MKPLYSLPSDAPNLRARKRAINEACRPRRQRRSPAVYAGLICKSAPPRLSLLPTTFMRTGVLHAPDHRESRVRAPTSRRRRRCRRR